MAHRFKEYITNQNMLFGPNIKEWLPRDHLAYFIDELVENLDLGEIEDYYLKKSRAGQAAYDPRLLLKLLIYGNCTGIRSSRKLEQATFDIVGFRILSRDQHPDHDTIARFRRVHAGAIKNIFLQVVMFCKKSGMVKMGHLSIDGTKIKGNANKSKSRNYKDLIMSERRLKAEIDRMMDECEQVDREEDELYGDGNGATRIPEHLLDPKKRLKFIRDCIKEMEEEAKEAKKKYKEEKEERHKEDTEWMEENDEKFERRPPKNISDKPTEEIITSRRNPTDYDARIMRHSQTGGYIVGYNAQAAVDAESQIIVAADLTNQSNDKQLAPGMLEEVIKNTGMTPTFLTADTGYWSERDIVKLEKMGVDPYIPPSQNSKGKRFIRSSKGRITITEDMRDKLETKTGKSIYRKRKTIVEPVFGQIKSCMNFTSFLMRGLEKVQAEWQMVCLSFNILKLFRQKVNIKSLCLE